MVITSLQIRQRLNAYWPDLQHIWLRNSIYDVPIITDVEELVYKYDRSDLPFIKQFNECENYALFLHSDVKLHRVIEYSKDKNIHNWAFGDMICNKKTLLGSQVHTANICLCADDIYIIEPMRSKNKIEKANFKKYKVFYVNLM